MVTINRVSVCFVFYDSNIEREKGSSVPWDYLQR